MSYDLQTRYGLAFHPFRPGLPETALWPSPEIDAFARRVAMTVTDGGFSMIVGEPGTGKSVALRLLAERFSKMRDLRVGALVHPQSGVADFYRELGELFDLDFPSHNRWSGFKTLRQRWAEHIDSSLCRPVLLIDEAQEMQPAVLSELRILCSKAFDSEMLLCVVLAGDHRLPERLRKPDLLPLLSRIRRRLELGYAERDALLTCLDHVLEAAGNPALMTSELKTALAEHAGGNFRTLMHMADELLTVALERDLPQLDAGLFFDLQQPPPVKKRRARTAP